MIVGHGDDGYRYGNKIVSNFSSNIYGGVFSPLVQEYIASHAQCVANYPHPQAEPLRSSLAHYHRIKTDEVCVTNGATEATYLIAQTFRGEKSAILLPTFSEYADACQMHGHKIKGIYNLDALPADARLLWICNPNNPTGQVIEKQTLTHFIEAHKDVLIVIDQSYEDFTLCPLFSAKEACSFDNVILLHSLTKRFGVPGLRIGYLTANAPLTEQIALQRMPWSVNALAIGTGVFLMEQDDTWNPSSLLQETARLRKQLVLLNILDVWPSDTHILLCQLRYGKTAALKDYLANEHGILIRDASNFNGLGDTFFRIATQTAKENDHLVAAIKKWITL
jgi:threonine-phosphate decarboxylase